MVAYGVWELGTFRYSNWLTQPWLKGYKQHAFRAHEWEYYDIVR